jgi:hypothetical protein
MLELAKQLDLSESVSNMFEDIGVGICGMQTLRNDKMLITTKKKLKSYVAKTPIPKIINDILSSTLEEIHKANSWQGDVEFISNDNTRITLIEWLHDDSCLIKYDSENPIKVNKKYFRGLYENRTI